MIRRDLYLNSILPFIDKPVIKVITEIRRSGKSEILKMMHNELLERGIQESHIIYMNFESFKWEKQKNAASLYAYMEQNINNQFTSSLRTPNLLRHPVREQCKSGRPYHGR